MEVISNDDLFKKFRKIPELKIDLGLAIKVDETKDGKDYRGGNWVIKDKAIKRYFDYSGKYIMRGGKIGTLLFYIDGELKPNDIYIMDEDDIFYFNYDDSPVKEFLGEKLSLILNKEIEPSNKVQEIKEEKVKDIKYMTNEELVEYFTKKSNQ